MIAGEAGMLAITPVASLPVNGFLAVLNNETVAIFFASLRPKERPKHPAIQAMASKCSRILISCKVFFQAENVFFNQMPGEQGQHDCTHKHQGHVREANRTADSAGLNVVV